jgi:hypothetical protein
MRIAPKYCECEFGFIYLFVNVNLHILFLINEVMQQS